MTQQRGFTLVELSIVLVILGLLIGGVLTGQSLIRAAELRSISTQFQRYVTATQTFRDKYLALPGDMPNATAYWGIAAGSTGNDSTCKAASSSTAATCNGDGNGKVDSSTGSSEYFHFWKQMANAGLIEGSYTGVPFSSSTYGATNLNSPSGRISASLWFDYNWGTMSGTAALFDGNYDNSLEFGLPVASSDPTTPVLKPEEIYNIDTKIDDGRPATGKVVMRVPNGLTWSTQTCSDATASSMLSANYLLLNTTLGCVLVFRQAF